MATFLFPELGPQRPGVGRPWMDHPSWRVVAEASHAARRDVGHLLVSAGTEELSHVGNAQLAALTLGLVAVDALAELGVTPTAYAGFGLGEYGALIAAGALSLRDGVSIATTCTKAIEATNHAHPGRMSTVLGLDDDLAEAACHRARGAAWIASYNAAGNVMIGGDYPSVESAVNHAYALGASRVLPGPVGGALHTPLVAPARDRLVRALRRAAWTEPTMPVVANVDGATHRDGLEWQALLSRGLTSPIRWRDSMRRLADLGERVFVEVGPGEVLSRLTTDIVAGVTALSVSAPRDVHRVLEVVPADGSATVARHHGEHLCVPERIVISPCAGVFQPSGATDSRERALIDVGTVLGRAGNQEVRSPFAGRLMGMLAFPGERVKPGQPIAWLRAG